jgi:hypothetical protein
VKDNIFKETKKKNDKVKGTPDNDENRMALNIKMNEENKKRKVFNEKKPAAAKITIQTKFAAFPDLLKGVVFTISGFQIPLRGEIRKKALEMLILHIHSKQKKY